MAAVSKVGRQRQVSRKGGIANGLIWSSVTRKQTFR
jgi:hypothetical protein